MPRHLICAYLSLIIAAGAAAAMREGAPFKMALFADLHFGEVGVGPERALALNLEHVLGIIFWHIPSKAYEKVAIGTQCVDWCCPHKRMWLCFARHTGAGREARGLSR
ncbi:hypothetical protein SASPL_129577 [Salvia splendens]|uniref:Uncharacterized protein n=1 Tax=Salvia splendens TaxID=180675 RepID=A0A8X8ZPJ8_SALSN|nr:hypothetical protein SASPL_129577 [Salvia splendens]